MGPKPKREIKSAVQFPVNPKKGDRGTTYGNKATWAAAVAKVDPKEGEKVTKEKDWRHQYPKYIVRQVQLGLKSPEKALAIAEAGLDFVYKNFEFIREGEQPMTLEAAAAKFTTHNFGRGEIKGSGKAPLHGAEVTIPYKPFGTKGPSQPLKGEKLRKQLHKWSDYGTIEPSARDAIEYLIDNPKALDLSNKWFVLLGASSAMGPYLTLLALGANIIALDIPVPAIWKDRLIAKARESPGRIVFPTKNKAKIDDLSDEEVSKVAGCDLLNEAPEIRNWLLEETKGKDVVVGGYAYLDGDLFVKLSLAMDMIIKDLTEKNKATPAFLCTPTDVHVIGEAANKAAEASHRQWSLLNLFLKTSIFQLIPGALVKNALKPVVAESGDKFYLVDGIVGRQGPNYALAKRIQHWRCIVARTKAGVNVSSNVAPSTATVSVTSNWLFALAYKGWHFFKPLEVFNEDTSNAVMAAVLIHDVQNPNAPVQPKNPLKNPLEIFYYGSLHGGIWRCAYKIDSLGEAAALLYLLLETPGGLLFLTSVIVALVAVFVHFLPQIQQLAEQHLLPLLNKQ